MNLIILFILSQLSGYLIVKFFNLDKLDIKGFIKKVDKLHYK